MKKNGFTPIVLLIILLAVILIIVGGIFIYKGYQNTSIQNPPCCKNNSGVVSTTESISPATSSIPLRPTVWGEYHVSLPDALILVDSQGRRTGENPVTQITYHEIPGTSYALIPPGSGEGSFELFTSSDLPSGQYKLYVIGGNTGSYWLDATHIDAQSQKFRGTIQTSTMIVYVQNYDLTNIASSSQFSLEGTASSTANITTAPPNNLAPPPIH